MGTNVCEITSPSRSSTKMYEMPGIASRRSSIIACTVAGSRLSSTSTLALARLSAETAIRIRPELVLQLEGLDSTPELGYPYGKALLDKNIPFTALFAYNDISAIGCMRAFQEAGLRVPDDISVVGFDDIAIASFSIPTLTTVRQPLLKMGRLAAETLLDRIEERSTFLQNIRVEPELVIRRSSGPPRAL